MRLVELQLKKAVELEDPVRVINRTIRLRNIFLDKRARAGEWVEMEQSEIDELSTLAGLEHRKAPALTPDEQNRWSRDKQKRRPVRAMKKPPQRTRKPR